MLPAWSVILTALVYLCGLFAIAHFADASGRRIMQGSARTTIYALALGVYCTSWTFYGSVGFASRSGLDFLAIYLGPALVVGFGHRFLARIVRIAKAQNITSIADFVGARYGKSERVAALVCVIAVIGALPYIALQLKAVSSSLTVFLTAKAAPVLPASVPILGDLAFVVAMVLASFAVAFGTRHIDATEHQDGLVIAIAAESVVKLVSFLAVGFFVVYGLSGGTDDLMRMAMTSMSGPPIWERTSGPGTFLTLVLLSACAALLLPRQFHMTVVENRDVADVRRAAWIFPLYLVLINLFVVPLAILGESLLTSPGVDRDMTVLLLPLQNGAELLALFVFIGGLSAATAMVIVASVALAIMISNHIVMPLWLRGRGVAVQRSGVIAGGDLGTQVLRIRRVAIVAVILLGYAYYRMAGEAALAAIGLLSFAAIAQVAPAFLGGLIWRRGTANGATAGLSIGLAVWVYTLLLPNLVPTDLASADSTWAHLVQHGPLSLKFLAPTALFGFEMPTLTHGVVWSLGLNILAYVAVSLMKAPSTIERLQANAFAGLDGGSMAQSLRLWRASVTVAELRGTVGRYLGAERTATAFEGFALSRGEVQASEAEADPHLLRFAEHLLSSAIGAASSRLVLSLLLKRGNLSSTAAFKLLDDASAAFQYNRDILQHGLDHAGQGITVLDKDMRIVAWNQAFLQLYDLPKTLVRFGTGLEDIVRFNALRGSYGEGPQDELVAARLESFVNDREAVRLRLHPTERVIEVRSNPLPDGGLVTTYADISDTVAAEEALERSNETLERRVTERTEELQRVNSALQRAKAEAEQANASKTQFLAAASHDILQPLNAARLYVSTLVERDRASSAVSLAENIDASLEAVEEILTTLLDISRLDSGAMKPEISSFRIDDILRQLQREFEPLAREKGLELIFVGSQATIRSDRRLLRRLLQNLVSNAIKYTPGGKVLVGCRRRGDMIAAMICDTGLGIPASKQKAVFREFQRLNQGAKVAQGLGLGLSIVERIARTLGHALTLRSTPGRGTVFTVAMPRVSGLPTMTAPREIAASPVTPLAGLRVLAIDNEPAILDGMRMLLGGWGCEIVTAAGISEARQIVNSATRRPDVVIADYHLDDGNGITAISEIRLILGPKVPAVLLTADRSQTVREAANAMDIQLLNKPLKPAALRSLLAQWRVTRIAAE